MQVDKTCRDLKISNINVLIGDLNSNVSSNNVDWKYVISLYGFGTIPTWYYSKKEIPLISAGINTS